MVGREANKERQVVIMVTKQCKTCGETKPLINFDARLRMSRPAKPPYGDYCDDCYLTQLCDNDNADDYLRTIRRRLGDPELIEIVDSFAERMGA